MDCITALFSEVDEQLGAIPTHPEAHLWPSAVGTLGLLHALKGGGTGQVRNHFLAPAHGGYQRARVKHSAAH
jgi:hypothetical protein